MADRFSLGVILCLAVVSGCDVDVAIPNPQVPIAAGRHDSALGSLRELRTAQEQFHALRATYASSLSQLKGEGLLNDPLATGTKSGYVFTVVSGDLVGYAITGEPKAVGPGGNRRFFLDQSGVIRFTNDASAILNAELPAVD